ncbi:hypothetical protein [Chryseobacterium rhizosphaerae]|uniref:Peptidase S74 domain-containing protein n=1 Tax=Chryseobacterium rhizosphaerae TaxID=395937 RepID=A0ABX9IIL7_9FLAO|nr:hypothetical protein [Chryseobacterium rhizosphaerae]REC74408.1 hypothetical protein DRF57_14205 [Chryseobacterium rhizosphaerae]GEN68232.1 hypothetical protein CRH01_28000 [Chryseobacterium rhizosphaerae]
MAKRTITQLKEYFKAGKRPTENQFGDLLDSYVHLDDPSVFPNSFKHKDLSVKFPSMESNLAVDILLGATINGNIEIHVVGAWNSENTVGIIKKQIIVGANPNGGIWYQPLSRIIEASGLITDHIYLSDIVWDSTIAQYKLTLHHTRQSGNVYAIRLIQHCNSTAVVDKAVLSDVYTNVLIGQNKHYVNYNDSVGIGTKAPQSKLDVVGEILSGSKSATEGVNAFSIRYENGSFNNWGSLRSGAETYMSYGAKASSTTAYGWVSSNGSFSNYKNAVTLGNEGIKFLGSASAQSAINSPVVMNESMRITPNGNVGIGTKNPDQKLAVKGKIHAEDVIVDTNVPADYVFQKYFDGQSSIRPDYQMPTISELESFVKENKHLPEIPSGEEIARDGVTLGDFQMKLLQKIEELTLYIISLKKEMDSKLN